MIRPAEACRESMERARYHRARWVYAMARGDASPNALGRGMWQSVANAEREGGIRCARRITRELVRALRAARRSEGALVERWGVK